MKLMELLCETYIKGFLISTTIVIFLILMVVSFKIFMEFPLGLLVMFITFLVGCVFNIKQIMRYLR